MSLGMPTYSSLFQLQELKGKCDIGHFLDSQSSDCQLDQIIIAVQSFCVHPCEISFLTTDWSLVILSRQWTIFYFFYHMWPELLMNHHSKVLRIELIKWNRPDDLVLRQMKMKKKYNSCILLQLKLWRWWRWLPWVINGSSTMENWVMIDHNLFEWPVQWELCRPHKCSIVWAVQIGCLYVVSSGRKRSESYVSEWESCPSQLCLVHQSHF